MFHKDGVNPSPAPNGCFVIRNTVAQSGPANRTDCTVLQVSPVRGDPVPCTEFGQRVTSTASCPLNTVILECLCETGAIDPQGRAVIVSGFVNANNTCICNGVGGAPLPLSLIHI